MKPVEPAVRSLPLYDPSPPHCDGWHAVRSPGGYELWYFDVEDDSGQVQIVAAFFEGFVFHPGYLRRYDRYLADPTRHAPPLPGEYPCAYLAVYEKGRLLARFVTQARPEDFSASPAGPEVCIGPNVLGRNHDGSLRLQMTGSVRGPGGGNVSCELAFQPQLSGPAPPAIEFISRRLSGADHRWVIANPLCRAQGEIRLGGTPGEMPNPGAGPEFQPSGKGVAPGMAGADGRTQRVISISGRGYHDHNFGSGPLGPGLRRWIRGRLLWADGMFAFHYARPRRRRLGDELHGVRADAAGIREVPVAISRTDWSSRTGLLVRFPTRLHLKTVEDMPVEIIMEAPTVIDSTPFYVRLAYDARVGDHKGKAFCEVGYARRLTWRLVGRLIERSIAEIA